jgi:hypothetical protein
MTSSRYWLWLKSHTARSGQPASAAATDVYSSVKERIESCFLGYQWLRLRFPETDTHTPCLDIRPRLAMVAKPAVTGMALRSIYDYAYDYADEHRDFICEVDLPESWFVGAVDGLLGIRLMTAVLCVLETAGSDLGIGMPKLRTPKVGAALPPYDHPFDRGNSWTDPRDQPEFLWVEEYFTALRPPGLLLIGRGGTDVRVNRQQQRLVDALEAADETTFDREEVRLRLWRAPGPQ